MRRTTKMLLALIIGLVLILGLSVPSQTTDINESDCRNCHPGLAITIHHVDNWSSHCTICHGSPAVYDMGENCLNPDRGCHTAKVE